MLGEVVQSDHSLAGVYENGTLLTCSAGEALRHFTDGQVRCAVAERVPDCTERENMRRFGTGDLFFTYATRVCAVLAGRSTTSSSSSFVGGYSQGGGLEISGMDGGVGGSGSYGSYGY